MSTSHMYTTKSSSPSSSPSYRRDEKVVDADDIERWLTGRTKTKMATTANSSSSSNANSNTNSNENEKEIVSTGLATANLTRRSTSITNIRSRLQQPQPQPQPQPTSTTLKERFRHKLRKQKQQREEQQRQRQQKKNQEQQFDKKKVVYCHQAAVAAMDKSTKVVDDRLSHFKNNNIDISCIETKNENENVFSFDDDNHAVEDNNNNSNNNKSSTSHNNSKSHTTTCATSSSSKNKNNYHDPIDLTATTTINNHNHKNNNNNNNHTNNNDDIAVTNDNDIDDEQQQQQQQLNDGRHNLATRVPVVVSSRSGMASPGIDAVRRRRQLRLRRRETDLEREQKPQQQQQQQQQENQLTTSMKSTSTTSKVTKNSAIVPILSHTIQHNDVGGIDNGDGNGNDNSDNSNKKTEIKDDSNFYNDDVDNNNNDNNNNNVDRHFFPVSVSKKIHFLKRHDAGGGGTPLSAVPVQVEGPSSAVQALQQTRLEGQDNTSSRRRRQEEEEEEEVMIQYPRLHKHKHLDNKVRTSSNNDIHDQTSANNINNTRRLKECVARSRLSRRNSNSNSNKYNHDVSNNNDSNGNSSYGGMLLKRHFRSGSISCSSVSTTGTTSTVSGVSVSSSKSNHSQFTFQSSADEEEAEEDEEGTTITSTSGSTHTTTGDGDGDGDNNDSGGGDNEEEEEISQLSIPVEVVSSFRDTNSIRNLSSFTPSLVKNHPQHHLTTTTSRSRPTTDRKRINVGTHEENDPSSVNQNIMLREVDEQQRKQQSLIPRIDSTSGEQSAVATLLKATTDVATTVSSALNINLLELKQQESTTNRIKLHVYDLVATDTQLDLFGCHFPLGEVFNAFNSTLHSIGTGAYHVGLEVNSVEYAYGANTTKGLTGVFTCMPKSSPGYQYRTTIEFGDRLVTKKDSKKTGNHRGRRDEVVHPRVLGDGREIIRLMATEYQGTDYDLLRKNCCTFAHDACIRLGISEEEIPSWFHNLASAGAVTQDVANFTLAPITQIFSEGGLDTFAQYLNETSLDDNDKIGATIQESSEVEKKSDECIVAYQF